MVFPKATSSKKKFETGDGKGTATVGSSKATSSGGSPYGSASMARFSKGSGSNSMARFSDRGEGEDDLASIARAEGGIAAAAHARVEIDAAVESEKENPQTQKSTGKGGGSNTYERDGGCSITTSSGKITNNFQRAAVAIPSDATVVVKLGFTKTKVVAAVKIKKK